MKYLTIIRHAKTEPFVGNDSDFARVLTKRGHKDAAHMAQLLQAWEPPIDWLVTSTAVRALETTAIFASTLRLPHEPAPRAELYAAAPSTILQVLAESPAKAEHVAVIAHNPGLEELASGLCAAPGSVQLILPTTGVAHLVLEIARWDQIRWGCGRLEFLIRPKLLR